MMTLEDLDRIMVDHKVTSLTAGIASNGMAYVSTCRVDPAHQEKILTHHQWGKTTEEAVSKTLDAFGNIDEDEDILV